MTDPILLAEKLEQLASIARDAKTDFEKAAVFAAASAIAQKFEADEDNFSSYVLENVQKARWGISAAVGYDVTNGHDTTHHVVSALGAAGTLKDVLKRGRP